MSNSTGTAAVLVHGAFADASGFAPVITHLVVAGHRVIAPPNPLRGLASDAATVRAVAAVVDGPVVLVGHSYGGAVITQASAGLANVTALVYLAAFALDEGESCASVGAPFPETLLAQTVRPTPYDAVGAAGGPDLYIDPDHFKQTFCADLPEDLVRVMAASQRPLAAAAFTQNATAAGWKTIPAWYQVARHDQAINPEAQRFMAERMNATVEEIDGSHTAFIARPAHAAALIEAALAKA